MAHNQKSTGDLKIHNREAESVSSLIPLQIRESAQKLIRLLEDYYNYLNQDGQATNIINRISSEHDIDLIGDDYLNEIKKEIAKNVPKSKSLSDRDLFRRIAEYYNTRGSQESAFAFFRLFFSEDVGLFYPSERLYKPSSGSIEAFGYLEDDGKKYPYDTLAGTFIDPTTNTERLKTVVNVSLPDVKPRYGFYYSGGEFENTVLKIDKPADSALPANKVVQTKFKIKRRTPVQTFINPGDNFNIKKIQDGDNATQKEDTVGIDWQLVDTDYQGAQADIAVPYPGTEIIRKNPKSKEALVRTAQTSPYKVRTALKTGYLYFGREARQDQYDFAGAIDKYGYYPLYTSETDANNAGSGTSHIHVFDGVTYYMPDGLQMNVTQFHGNYTRGPKNLKSTYTPNYQQIVAVANARHSNVLPLEKAGRQFAYRKFKGEDSVITVYALDNTEVNLYYYGSGVGAQNNKGIFPTAFDGTGNNSNSPALNNSTAEHITNKNGKIIFKYNKAGTNHPNGYDSYQEIKTLSAGTIGTFVVPKDNFADSANRTENIYIESTGDVVVSIYTTRELGNNSPTQLSFNADTLINKVVLSPASNQIFYRFANTTLNQAEGVYRLTGMKGSLTEASVNTVTTNREFFLDLASTTSFDETTDPTELKNFQLAGDRGSMLGNTVVATDSAPVVKHIDFPGRFNNAGTREISNRYSGYVDFGYIPNRDIQVKLDVNATNHLILGYDLKYTRGPGFNSAVHPVQGWYNYVGLEQCRLIPNQYALGEKYQQAPNTTKNRLLRPTGTGNNYASMDYLTNPRRDTRHASPGNYNDVGTNTDAVALNFNNSLLSDEYLNMDTGRNADGFGAGKNFNSKDEFTIVSTLRRHIDLGWDDSAYGPDNSNSVQTIAHIGSSSSKLGYNLSIRARDGAVGYFDPSTNTVVTGISQLPSTVPTGSQTNLTGDSRFSMSQFNQGHDNNGRQTDSRSATHDGTELTLTIEKTTDNGNGFGNFFMVNRIGGLQDGIRYEITFDAKIESSTGVNGTPYISFDIGDLNSQSVMVGGATYDISTSSTTYETLTATIDYSDQRASGNRNFIDINLGAGSTNTSAGTVVGKIRNLTIKELGHYKFSSAQKIPRPTLLTDIMNGTMKNGEFSTAGTAGQPFADWRVDTGANTDPGVTVTRDTTQTGITGSACAKISIPAGISKLDGAPDPTYVALASAPGATDGSATLSYITPGTYEVTVRYKGTGGLWGVGFDVDARRMNLTPNTGLDWTEKTMIFDVPSYRNSSATTNNRFFIKRLSPGFEEYYSADGSATRLPTATEPIVTRDSTLYIDYIHVKRITSGSNGGSPVREPFHTVAIKGVKHASTGSIAISVDGANFETIVNNVDTTSILAIDNTSSLRVGANLMQGTDPDGRHGNTGYNGQLRSLLFYDKALNNSEIATCHADLVTNYKDQRELEAVYANGTADVGSSNINLNKNISLDAWINPYKPQYNTRQIIIGKRFMNEVSYSLSVRQNKFEIWLYMGTEKQNFFSVNDIFANNNGSTDEGTTPGPWHHICAVVETEENTTNHTFKLFHNGVRIPIARGNNSMNLVDIENPSDKYTYNKNISTANYNYRTQLVLGGTYNSGGSPYSHYLGKISKASIYSKALTDAEVLQNFNANKGYHGITGTTGGNPLNI